MERQKVVLDIGLALLTTHVEQRIKLEDAAALLENIQGGAVVALPAHQAADPNFVFLFELF